MIRGIIIAVLGVAIAATGYWGYNIWPSATAVNASGSKMTPATVFGNNGLLIRFKITAAMATCPSNVYRRCRRPNIHAAE